jgi:hypothetical protein
VAWVPVVSALRRAGPGRPSHVDIPSRVDIIPSQGPVPLEGFTWHGSPWCLLYVEQVPGGLLTSISHRGLTSSRAKGPCRSRVLRGMGARGACSTSSRSRAAFSRRYPVEGCFLSGAKGSCRSRVLRGMGARGACSTSSRSRAAFSRRYPVEGCFCFELRVRPARGFSLLGKGPGHLNASRSWPRFCSAGAPF